MLSKIVSSKIFFFIIATTVILILNLIPLINHIRHAPEGRSFTLIHNNAQDFFFYQSLMNQGANGSLLTYDPYTSEPHQPSIIFSYFLWLGKLSKLLGFPHAITYHLTRIMISILFLSSVFWLLSSIRIPYPRMAFLFFLFAAPFMHTINDDGKLLSVPFMHWWNGIDPIRRAAFLPHHMLGGLLLILSIILLFKYIHQPNKKYLIWMIFISTIMAFVHTPSLLIVLLVLTATILFHTLLLRTAGAKEGSQERLKTLKESVIGLLIYWVTGLLMLLFMISQTKTGFPWSQYIEWEKNLQFPLERDLIGALGILLPFSMLGILGALKSKKFEYILAVCWFAAPLVLIPLAPKFNISNARLIQGVPYLPLAILTILGIKTIEEFIKSLKTPRNKLVILSVLFIFAIFTLPTLQWSLKDQIREFMPIYGNAYLDNRLFKAFEFINQNFPAKTITLGTFYTGNYLPAFTHTISFIGHFGYTYNLEEKEKLVRKFFENKMSANEAKNSLLSNKITLVFQGPEEKPIYEDHLYPSILKPIYDKEEVTIYKTNF